MDSGRLDRDGVSRGGGQDFRNLELDAKKREDADDGAGIFGLNCVSGDTLNLEEEGGGCWKE
jgi:hypothetical protein